jgi:exodeoxyribonuclease VII large subunit
MERFAATVATASAQLAASHPGARIAAARQGISALGDLLGVGTLRRLERERGRFARLQSALAALSPEATLARGFSITRNEEGRVITSAGQVKRGESIRTQLAQGEVGSEVRKVD